MAGSKILHQKTRLNFQIAPTNMVMWSLQIKILYWVIMTMTKTGYNIGDNKFDSKLRLHNFREELSGSKKISGVLRGNCFETCNIPQKTPRRIL